MNVKECIKCKKIKNIKEFYKYNGKYINCCKECKKQYLKEYYFENKEKAKINNQKYYQEHKETINQQCKEYGKKHRQELTLKRKIYDKNNEEIVKEKRKQYYIKNKDKILKNSKEYYLKNKEKIIERNNIYLQNNRKRLTLKASIRNKKRRKEDKIYKLKCQVRDMLNDSFRRKYKKKNKHAEEILCCSVDFFINYLLQTFKNNYGYEWDGKEKVHIDHIKPLKNANTKEDIIKLCYYKNLQLLKAKDNLRKKDKMEYKIGG